MKKGVDVIAVADGTVAGVRDSEPDIHYKKLPKGAVEGKECGNGVVMEHDGLWETQYCHLMKGSIIVERGQKLKKGDVIGKVGLSGQTEFPHVHLSIRHDGETVDPFIGRELPTTCKDIRDPLWDTEVSDQLAYIDTAILNVHFTDKVPKIEQAREGKYRKEVISRSASAIIAWVEFFGLLKGDKIIIKITKPDGGVLVRDSKIVPKNKAVFFQYAGKKIRADLTAGTYVAHISLERQGKTKLEAKKTVKVK